MRENNIYYQVYESLGGDRSCKKTRNLVLLHGFMGSTLDWNSLIDFLTLHSANPLKIVSILLPGHTQGVSNFLENTVPKKDFSKIQNTVDDSNKSINKLAKQILEIQKKENILNCNYLGYSMGARLAIELASLNKNIKTLILESSFIYWENKKEQDSKKKEDDLLLTDLINKTEKQNNLKTSKEFFKKFLLTWYSSDLFKGLSAQVNFLDTVNTRLQNNPLHLQKALQAYSSSTIKSYLEVLKKLPCPIHYIYGEHDIKYKKIALDLKQNISAVHLREVKNASHNVHLQQTLSFNKLILDILA